MSILYVYIMICDIISWLVKVCVMERKINGYISKIKGGDMSAFDKLYAETSKGVYFMALSVLKDRGLAEEIMQETYIRLLKNLDNFDDTKNAMNWLLTMSKNLAINLYNRNKREIVTDPSLVTPDRQYTMRDNSIIDMALKNLSQTEFNVLMLCEIKGFKRREVAAMLDMPLGTVTWHYNKALKKLREILSKEENS